MPYYMFRQMAALEPSKTTFRHILKWQRNPKLRQVPLGMCFPSQHNSILFSCRSTGSLRIRRPWTFPYASAVSFFHEQLGTCLTALKGDILQNNLQRRALKITAPAFPKLLMILQLGRDITTVAERAKKWLLWISISCSALSSVFVQLKENGGKKWLQSLHGMNFLKF